MQRALAAEQTAQREGWFLIPDTSDGSVVEAPRNVMRGYTLLIAEALEQLRALEHGWRLRVLDASGPAVDHAHIFELHCKEEPAVRVDGREVIWAGFLPPEQALAWGLVSPVRRYLSRPAAS